MNQQIRLFSLGQEQPSYTREQIIVLARMAELTATDLEPPKPVIVKDLANERHIHRADGRTVRVLKTQDYKYGVLLDSSHGETLAWLANIESGMEIPDTEPVFILRGQDLCAPAAIDGYCRAVQERATAINTHTLDSAAAALERFFRFQAAFPNRCKLPS